MYYLSFGLVATCYITIHINRHSTYVNGSDNKLGTSHYYVSKDKQINNMQCTHTRRRHAVALPLTAVTSSPSHIPSVSFEDFLLEHRS